MSTKGGAMNALPYLAGPATRHAWAEREYAQLQADLVQVRLAAGALAGDRAARRRARLRALLRDLLPARPVRRPEPARSQGAAAPSARIVRPLGGSR
ncbi:hypothetical protein F8568_029740 [Actinomadura sp. LD22]|uniref:Uncharacterized protein n=1 Tax=Actinomadura physcomitrii TaxID=2650748 RepID=A0A6I4MKK2_9ACTN|nr:hypothetical protein [Actinomadura physcomitrii]MWA04487.1 hypothetical protein [Actinomadura physcomitrii]